MFRAWLDSSRLPYLCASGDSVPEHFRGLLTRPNYLVALPYTGTIAFNVKAMMGQERGYFFDVAEVRALATFDDLFRVSTFFAVLDPAGSARSVWFRLPDLVHAHQLTVKGEAVYSVPVTAGIQVDMDRPFQEALRVAISLG